MITSGDDDFVFFIRIEIVLIRPENCIGREMKI